MTASSKAEFHVVDLIVNSNAKTRGVDAFALSVIKMERQIRKLMTHVVFQFPCFDYSHIPALRNALGRSTRVYFEGFERGFDALYPRRVRDLIGNEYERLRPILDEAIDHRNKLFHGQLTSKSLSTDDLLEFVGDIRAWCDALAENAAREMGYDGFERNSFRKSVDADVARRLKIQFTGLNSYTQFIGAHMERQRRS